MDIELKPISVYRNEYKYKVIAGFYTNNRGIPSRAFADITTEDHIENDIDAYIIMINPGSCKPTTSDFENILKKSEYYSKVRSDLKKLTVSEAVCDMAQKCVMELMHTCNMKKVRILNLSDVRSGNLDDAKVLMGDEKIQMAESIFSPERGSDRAVIMPNDVACFISWGTDNKFKLLKRQAMECLAGYNIIGESVDEKNFSYRYIKPRGKKNQEFIIGKLAEKYLASFEKS